MADLSSANGLAVAGSLLLLSGAVVLGRTAFVSLNSHSSARNDLSVATDKVGTGFGMILLCAGLFVQTCSLLNGGGAMTPLIACFMLAVAFGLLLFLMMEGLAADALCSKPAAVQESPVIVLPAPRLVEPVIRHDAVSAS